VQAPGAQEQEEHEQVEDPQLDMMMVVVGEDVWLRKVLLVVVS
jgi:hypothetical protein